MYEPLPKFCLIFENNIRWAEMGLYPEYGETLLMPVGEFLESHWAVCQY